MDKAEETLLELAKDMKELMRAPDITDTEALSELQAMLERLKKADENVYVSYINPRRLGCKPSTNIWLGYSNHTFERLPADIDKAMEVVRRAYEKDDIFFSLFYRPFPNQKMEHHSIPYRNEGELINDYRERIFAGCREWIERVMKSCD